MDNQLETTKPIKLKPKQKLAINYWLDPESETFGNLYRSVLKAQFRPSYALNVSHLKPLWLSETIDQMQLDPQHIKQGVQRIATGKIDSRSVDDTRLKAYELLGRYAGIDNQGKGQTTNILVQPILNGQSTKITDKNNTDTNVYTIDNDKPAASPNPTEINNDTDLDNRPPTP